MLVLDVAGHSKFKNIMHRKGAQDARRGKIFARHAREISVAAASGSDPAANSALRQAILAARAVNMPKDRIDRAISSKHEKGNLDDIRYEGYGPGGIAVIAETLTDNKNRTCADLRKIFSSAGGSLGESGSVSFLFERLGIMVYPVSGSMDEFLEVTLECGAEDCVPHGKEYWKVLSGVGNFHNVSDAMVDKLGVPVFMGLVWEPKEKLPLDEEYLHKGIAFLDGLEEHEDVQTVFCNMDHERGFGS